MDPQADTDVAHGPAVGGDVLRLVLGIGCMNRSVAESVCTDERRAQWAQPIALASVRNLHRVSDDLYRSGQPTAAGMRALDDLGVKTVINLRLLDADRAMLKGTRLDYVRMPMVAWLPREKDIVRFLGIVTDEKRAPVLVHCRVGADRTGMLMAAYRVVIQGWTKTEAIEEMTRGGYGFNPLWQTLVYRIKRLDVDRVKQELGLMK